MEHFGNGELFGIGHIALPQGENNNGDTVSAADSETETATDSGKGNVTAMVTKSANELASDLVPDSIADRTLTKVVEYETHVVHNIPFTKMGFLEWLKERNEQKFGDSFNPNNYSISDLRELVQRELDGIHCLLSHAEQAKEIQFKFMDLV